MLQQNTSAEHGSRARANNRLHRARRAPRVLYVWDDEYPWDTRTEKVCAALRDHGCDVHLIARNPRWAPECERLPEGFLHRMPPWRALGRTLDSALAVPTFFNPRWLALLSRTIRDARPDVVIVRDVPLCPTGLHAAHKAGIPVVLDLAENYPPPVVAVERYCVRRVDRVLVVIEEAGERLTNDFGVAPDRIDVVSNTPPRSRAERPPRPLRDARPLEVAYVGPLEMSRGIGEMIAAAAALRDRIALRMTVIGDGCDADAFRAQATALGLSDGEITFTGHLPQSETLELLAQANLGVVPHRAIEAWSTTIPEVLFEYMAAGLAVISSDAAPAARIVRASRAGDVFRAGDPDDLARAIGRLSDAQRCAEAARAGRQAILRRYHWEQDAARLVNAVTMLSAAGETAVA